MVKLATIEHLIGDLSPEQFFSEYWTRHHCYIPGSPDRFDQVFSSEDYASAILVAALGEDDFSVARQGNTSNALWLNLLQQKSGWQDPPDFTQLESACSQDGTLVFNSIHRRVESLKRWTLSLVQELCESVAVNAYFSPAASVPGLDLHYDPQEIFVIQVAGSKRWEVWDRLETHPLKFDKPKGYPDLELGDSQTLTMQPGDVLYLPRGTWHRAVAIEQTSLHLTVTIVPRNLVKFLAWIADEIATDPNWRADLPLQLAGDADCDKEFFESVQQLASKIEQELSRPDLTEAFRRKNVAEACLFAAK
jgi:ribosomal protein L16 Arg81 hydroxylase